MLTPLYSRFPQTHPERRQREIFVGNTLCQDVKHPWFTHFRYGRVSYDYKGNDISHQGFRPVFVSKLEFLRKKIFDKLNYNDNKK